MPRAVWTRSNTIIHSQINGTITFTVKKEIYSYLVWSNDGVSCFIRSSCAPMLRKRNSVAAGALNGFIYAIGGNEATSSLTSLNRYDCGERWVFLKLQKMNSQKSLDLNSITFVLSYDPKTNQWTLISNISKPREAIALTSLGSSCLFVAGGYDGMRFRNECEKYDPIKNEWTKVGSWILSSSFASIINSTLTYRFIDTIS